MAATTPLTSASLYVGDLAPEVTENDLNDKFSQIGVIASIRLCRDSVTRRSLGYGYVNFNSPADAERAIQIMNFSDLKGKPCRVCWSQRDPTVRRSGVGNTFVKNLAASVDSKRLFDEFSRFGNILSVKLGADHTGKPLGYGFVHFETQESAQAAIDAAKAGLVIEGSPVTVDVYQPKQRGSNSENFTNVYVKNVPLSWSNEEFEKYFAAFGKITSALLKRNPESGESMGFGFVNYATHDEAKNAIQTAHNAAVQDGELTKTLFACRALSKSELSREKLKIAESRRMEQQQRWAGCNLYVKFLPETITEEALRQKFAEFGEISSVKLVQTQDGMNTGVGYVCFANADGATKALQAMNGAVLEGTRRLYVSLHQSKTYREQAQREQSRFGMYPRGGPMFQQGPGPKFGYMMPMQQRPQGGMRRPNMRRGPPAGSFPPMQAQQPRRVNRGGAPRPQGNGDIFKQLHTMSPDSQKQLLGEHLYPMVVNALGADASQAPKITGMLLEMDPQDVVRAINEPEVRMAKINEALTVLAEAQQ
eukprot:TRINITY_DN93848_c0_g1_i1.p1 TRINITY_DN93848_c0_g1~~TRINITY_DN93848_c0_g1_i1.p1  ORF type:complete len:535 (+),score=82.26 TRINITY_DN93848_c0_g1_i1:71-1675(+)